MKYWWIVSLSILIPCVFCHGLPHIIEESNPLFQQLKTYVETNVSTKQGQVALSIFIVSFPSIPVFFGLSFLGKLLKTKSDKHNFSDKLLNLLLAFACGTILGDVMLHILPFLFAQGNNKEHHDEHDHHDCEHHDEHEHDHDHHHGEGSHDHGDMKTPLMIIGGIILFLFLDFLFMKLHSKHNHHGHSHGHKKEHKHKQVKSATQGKGQEKTKVKKDKKSKVEDEKTVKEIAKELAESEEKVNDEEEEEEEEHSAVPFLIGDFLHNITDGIAIGAAYNVSLQMGLMSTFVIMIHEMPHEIGDFAHLIKYGYSLQKILSTQFLTSLGALLGGFIGLAGGSIYKTELLSVTAGGFMYMCLTQVIPEILQDLHKHHSIWHMLQIIASLLLGVSLMYGVTLIE